MLVASFVAATGGGSVFAEIDSPEEEDTVRGSVPVTGSAGYSGPGFFDFFFDVFVCPEGEGGEGDFGGCTNIGHGTAPVSEGTLATWDTTQFQSHSFFDIFLQVNGSHEVDGENMTHVETDSEQEILVDNLVLPANLSLDHYLIDLENYYDEENYFYDPKCTWLYAVVNESEDEEGSGIDSVKVHVGSVLRAMFANVPELSSFDEEEWERYFEDEMHDVLELDEDDGYYRYWFCPAVHISHLAGDRGDGDYEVISYGDVSTLLSEKLVLGEFGLVVTVRDEAGNEANSSVTVTVADVTVPLEEGWNLRSTPISLEDDSYFTPDEVDAILRWNSATQSWELVTDNSLTPLDAHYIHATGESQIGYVIERGLSAPPARLLNSGWNLGGVALELRDYWYPADEDNCSPWEYDSEDCRLSQINTNSENTCIGTALSPIIYAANGTRALEVVLSPRQYLDYSSDWGDWYFDQDSFTWIPDIDEQGDSPDNECEEYVYNFGGYWMFSQNEDTLPGFTTTPFEVNYDD